MVPFTPHDHIFHISSWPWESPEQLELYDKEEQSALMELEESPSPNLHPHNYSTSTTKITPYSLSSGASTCSSVSRYSSSRSTQSPATFSPSPSSIEKFTRLWDDEDDYELGRYTSQLPPIHPSDYLKTLLCQLAVSISSIKTAYAHQQSTLNPYNMREIFNGQEGGSGGGSMDAISETDKAMVEELQRLSQLHSQLALLPHMLTFKEGAEVAVEEKKDSTRQQLKRYESIITRFHEEMRRKDAVAEALKETLAKSMLKGEKLQQRVKALEAKLSTRATPHTH